MNTVSTRQHKILMDHLLDLHQELNKSPLRHRIQGWSFTAIKKGSIQRYIKLLEYEKTHKGD